MKLAASCPARRSARSLIGVATLIVVALATVQPALARKDKKKGKTQASVGRVEHDPLQNTTVTTLASPIRLKGSGRFSRSRISLTPRKVEDGRGIRYDLEIQRRADNWLFIREGESLVLLLDGSFMGLSGDGSREHSAWTGDGSVRELALYDVSPKQLEKIAGAEEIRLHLFGDQRYSQRTFKARDLERLARWVETFVEPESPALPVVVPPGFETAHWCHAMLERRKLASTSFLLRKCKTERPEEPCRKCLGLP